MSKNVERPAENVPVDNTAKSKGRRATCAISRLVTTARRIETITFTVLYHLKIQTKPTRILSQRVIYSPISRENRNFLKSVKLPKKNAAVKAVPMRGAYLVAQKHYMTRRERQRSESRIGNICSNED